MAEARTKATKRSVSAYLDAIEDEARRKDCEALAAMMKRITGCEPKMWGTAIVGFDQFHYKYASGHEGDSCVIGFSSRKVPISIYMAAGCDVDLALLPRLGKHKMGKGCLYLSKLTDVNLPVLEKILARAVTGTKQRYPANAKKGTTP